MSNIEDEESSIKLPGKREQTVEDLEVTFHYTVIQSPSPKRITYSSRSLQREHYFVVYQLLLFAVVSTMKHIAVEHPIPCRDALHLHSRCTYTYAHVAPTRVHATVCNMAPQSVSCFSQLFKKYVAIVIAKPIAIDIAKPIAIAIARSRLL